MTKNKIKNIKSKAMDVYMDNIADLCVATLIILVWAIIAAISPFTAIIGGLLVMFIFIPKCEEDVEEIIIIEEEEA